MSGWREMHQRPGPWFRNFYHCDDCGHKWEDIWDAQPDDDCPKCGSRHWSPYKSEDVDGPEG